MERAGKRLRNWWRLAYLPGSLRETFVEEVRFALPGVARGGEEKPKSMFEMLMLQCSRLKRDQLLEEWGPA